LIAQSAFYSSRTWKNNNKMGITDLIKKVIPILNGQWAISKNPIPLGILY